MVLYMGYGANDCTGTFGTPIRNGTFDAGLLDFRTEIQAIDPHYSTYYPDSFQHTWLGSPTFYTETEGDTKFIDWFTKLVGGTAPGPVGQ